MQATTQVVVAKHTNKPNKHKKAIFYTKIIFSKWIISTHLNKIYYITNEKYYQMFTGYYCIVYLLSAWNCRREREKIQNISMSLTQILYYLNKFKAMLNFKEFRANEFNWNFNFK